MTEPVDMITLLTMARFLLHHQLNLPTGWPEGLFTEIWPKPADKEIHGNHTLGPSCSATQ